MCDLELLFHTKLQFNFRPRNRDLLAVPKACTVVYRKSPLVRALDYLNTLLMSAPDCDVFAGSWKMICDECKRLCEAMDDRPSSVSC
jgi:hypothetical protein